MAGSFIIDGDLVTKEYIDERIALGQIEELRAVRAPLSLDGATAFADGVPAFREIGIGKPLSIEILTVYTGDAPGRFLGGLTGAPDMLVTSGAKGAPDTGVAPRAINQLVQSIADYQYLAPSAFANGSPVVYYSPAVADSTILTSYELVVDSFDHKLFESVAALFATAGGLPVFAPASAYLLAGSVVMKMFAQLGKALLETDPFLRADLDIRFDTPMLELSRSRHVVLYNAGQAREFEGYEARQVGGAASSKQLRLVDKQDGREYDRAAPYIIASLDGRVRHDLENFTAKQASAEVLEGFYKAASGPKTVEVVESALGLYNDFTYREKATRLAAEIDKLAPDSEARPQAEKLLDAYKANIKNDLFKLS